MVCQTTGYGLRLDRQDVLADSVSYKIIDWRVSGIRLDIWHDVLANSLMDMIYWQIVCVHWRRWGRNNDNVYHKKQQWPATYLKKLRLNLRRRHGGSEPKFGRLVQSVAALARQWGGRFAALFLRGEPSPIHRSHSRGHAFVLDKTTFLQGVNKLVVCCDSHAPAQTGSNQKVRRNLIGENLFGWNVRR